MKIEELQKLANDIREKYNKFNADNGQKAWGGEHYAMGFVGDVGDLVKLVMARENFRKIDDADEKLRHELRDCLWSVLVLANFYDINLSQEFPKFAKELSDRIDQGDR